MTYLGLCASALLKSDTAAWWFPRYVCATARQLNACAGRAPHHVTATSRVAVQIAGRAYHVEPWLEREGSGVVPHSRAVVAVASHLRSFLEQPLATADFVYGTTPTTHSDRTSNEALHSLVDVATAGTHTFDSAKREL